MNAPGRPVLAFARIPIEFNWGRLSAYARARVYTFLGRKKRGEVGWWLDDLPVCRGPSYFSLSLFNFFLLSSFFIFFFFEGTVFCFYRGDDSVVISSEEGYIEASLNERCHRTEFLHLPSIIRHRDSLTLLISRELPLSAASSCWPRIFYVLPSASSQLKLRAKSSRELLLPNCYRLLIP